MTNDCFPPIKLPIPKHLLESGYDSATCHGCRAPGYAWPNACQDCHDRWDHEREQARRADDRQRRIQSHDAQILRASGTIPSRYDWARFGAPELRERVRMAGAIDKAKAAVDANWVVLVGGAGSGKTSLACAMMRAILDRPTWESPREERDRAYGALFAGAYWLAKARHEHPLGAGEAPPIKKAIEATVLVLDDLGLEQARNTAVAEVIYERHAAERQTIITTGFGYSALAERYGDGIARRIVEKGRVTVIKCSDIATPAPPSGSSPKEAA
jgi:DNA replication protein DnaC